MDNNSIQTRLKEVAEWLQAEYAGIRTGQAAPALLDSIRVESYGSLLPLNQVGSIGIEDARTLRISPWDVSQVAAIERAIREADLGVSSVSDSSGIRVVFPELTAERRTQLQKLAKGKLEDARVRVRGVRDDAMKEIDKAFKDGDISEDQRFARKDSVQKFIDEANRNLEAVFVKKDAELAK